MGATQAEPQQGADVGQPLFWVQLIGYLFAGTVIITDIIALAVQPANPIAWITFLMALAFLGVLIWLNVTHGWVR